jgi:hypothetical protein
MTKSATRVAADKVTFTQAEVTAGDTAARAGRKNLIINGSMQVSQRGNLTGLTENTSYAGPDRFKFATSGNGQVFDLSQGSSGPSGFTNTTRIDCSTAGTTLTGGQEIKSTISIEGYDVNSVGFGTATAKPLTFSFWVKSNQVATYVVWAYRPDGSRHNSKTYTIDVADEWEFKTITFQADNSSEVTSDNTKGLDVAFIHNSGPTYTSGTSPNGSWENIVSANRYAGLTATIGNSVNDYIEITGVQLETGSGTDFEHRSYGEELLLCQRYYSRKTNLWNDTGGTTGHRFVPRYEFPVTMRHVPSITLTNITTSSMTSPTPNATSTEGTFLYANLTSTTIDGHFTVGIFQADAEL